MRSRLVVFDNSDSLPDFIEFVRSNQNDVNMSIFVPENKDCLIITLSRIDI